MYNKNPALMWKTKTNTVIKETLFVYLGPKYYQTLPNTRKNEGITYVKLVFDQRVKEKLSIVPKHTKMTSISSIIYCKKEPRTNSHKLTHIDNKHTKKETT